MKRSYYIAFLLFLLYACAGNKETNYPIEQEQDATKKEDNVPHLSENDTTEAPGGLSDDLNTSKYTPDKENEEAEGGELPPPGEPKVALPDQPSTEESSSNDTHARKDKQNEGLNRSEVTNSERKREISTADTNRVRTQVKGSLTRYVPDSMSLKKISHVQLVLSSATSRLITLAKLNPHIRDAAVSDTLPKLTQYISAELIDYNAVGDERFFDISLTGGQQNSIQYLDLEDTTHTAKWDWAVRPLKAGEHTLQLKVSLNLDGKQSPTGQPVFTPIALYGDTVIVMSPAKPIAVPTDPVPITSMRSFWTMPLIALGMISLLGIPLFFIYRKKRNKQLLSVQENDNHADPEEITLLIRNGEIEKAVGELLDLAKLCQSEDVKNDIIVQQTRWSHLEDDIRQGIISREAQQMERNKIHLALLHILDELAEKFDAD